MEDQNYEKKSLSFIKGKNPQWRELAKDCVGFANARGGTIVIGIDDNQSEPPSEQKIDSSLLVILRKRISELTINTGINVSIKKSSNGGE